MSMEIHCSSDVFKILKLKQFHKIVKFLSEDIEDIAQATSISYKVWDDKDIPPECLNMSSETRLYQVSDTQSDHESGLSELAGLRQVLLAKYAAIPVCGDKLYNSALASTAILSTASKRLDELLDGGIYSGEVTEFAGGIASGKTQICLGVTATLASRNKQNAVYIDTNAAFYATRFLQIVTSNGQEKEEESLARVSHADVFTIEEVLTLLDEIRDRLERRIDPFYRDLKLVVLDCVAAIIYPILGTGSFAENQCRICILGQKLKYLAVEFSIAVLVTNNVVTSDSGTRTASLGKAWSHVPHVRVLVGASNVNLQQQERTAMLSKSPRSPLEVLGRYTITNKGMADQVPHTTMQTGVPH